MYDEGTSKFSEDPPEGVNRSYSEEEVTDDESYEEVYYEEQVVEGEIPGEVLEEYNMVDGNEHFFEVFEENTIEDLEVVCEEQPEVSDYGGEGEETQQQDQDGDAEEEQNGHANDEHHHHQQQQQQQQQQEHTVDVFEEHAGEGEETQQPDREGDAEELQNGHANDEQLQQEHTAEVFEEHAGEREETPQHERDGDAEELQNGHINDQQQQQQQQQQQEPAKVSTEPLLAQEADWKQLLSLPYEITILHDLLKEADWKQLLSILAHLRTQNPVIIEAALVTLDTRNSTPLHIAVWKAPTPLVKLLMSVIPLDVRELLLLKQDIDGNTPLHLACANLELKSDGTLDMTMLGLLVKDAPNAHETVNCEGDTPLHLLLTSPAFRADPQNFQAEAYAEEMVKITLKNRIQLASTLNNSGATLLHVACAHGAHERVLMILLELAPKSAELVDNEGMLPLHYVAACISGKCTPAIFAEKLVEANQEAVIHPCNTGDTPLHFFLSNAKKNIDKHERNSRNTAKVVEALLGSADFESMCPLLMKNKDSVSNLLSFRRAPFGFDTYPFLAFVLHSSYRLSTSVLSSMSLRKSLGF